ncbi:DUF2157 domain-containing protein [Schlegelella sp. S2-27]|uniref:DUF2157 domain-containing protein n=1 Tax=Caldimonas mangrovi TaxID=2944811 RepID=A0ABT0YPD3_9BURK|nr:DUF2157 domain-containing protein [Caldimonas mangrovi]MCM5680595.1 DUF2157 domain-containing protein [Caldimonas mangrovi]
MTLRLRLYELAARHRLDGTAQRRLRAWAGLEQEPPGVGHWLPQGAAVLAAALAGLGIVFWVAANWDALGRVGQFALLQCVVLAGCAVAWRWPSARHAGALAALLGIGGLFAYFGQTYQTGADPWQLFALWATLALPLCVALRSDVLWAPWAVVAATGISLWVHAHAGHRWTIEPEALSVHAAGWGAAAALVFVLGPALRRHTGAGTWSWRTALTLCVVMVSATALGGLFHREVAPHYLLGLALLAAAAGALAWPRSFDLYGLSAVGLGLNTLLVAGLARWLFDDHRGDPIGPLLLLGLVAAALLAGTVTGVLKLARARVSQGAAA